ncbi:MAG TPA: nitroreductase family deazaflavin-dependent oxidoreductase [Candidatus Xenobia bacterium]|jgi:deazaflavin-dependent oxidoreductase (nitroreductase family)
MDTDSEQLQQMLAQLRQMNPKVMDEFRANSGQVGGMFAGFPLLILTVIGRKSGQAREVPLVYFEDGGHVYIIASKGGYPEHPIWFDNLVAHPDVTIERGTDKYKARAVILEGAERDGIFAKVGAAMPNFAEYQAKTTRKIPVIRLDRA